MEENFSHHEPMLYNHLFRTEFGTIIYEVVPEELPIGNLKYITRIFNTNNVTAVKYIQNNTKNLRFGSLGYPFSAIGDYYTEKSVPSRIQ